MKFDSLTFKSAGAVSIEEDDPTVLSGSSTADSLILKSIPLTTSTISNADGASLTVVNNASFTAFSIILGDKTTPADTMNFDSLTFSAAGPVKILEDSATVITQTNQAGSLELQSTGSIDVNGPVSVTTTSILDAAGSITINNALTAGSSAMTAGGSITINGSVGAGSSTMDAKGSITINGSVNAGSSSMKALGTITNGPGATISVTANAMFNAPSIDLGNQVSPLDTMKFDTLTFNSSGPVSISQDSKMTLTGINKAGILSLNTTTGSIVTGVANTDTLTVADTSVMTADDSITIGGIIHIFGSSSMTATKGTITNSAGASLTVDGNAAFTTTAAGKAITLGTQLPDTMVFGSLTFNSLDVVTIEADSDIVLAGSSKADSLSLASLLKSITNAAGTSLVVTKNASFKVDPVAGTAITLGNQVSPLDNMQFGTLTFDCLNGAVKIEEDDSTTLANGSRAKSLILKSTDFISNNAGASLVVTGNATFDDHLSITGKRST